MCWDSAVPSVSCGPNVTESAHRLSCAFEEPPRRSVLPQKAAEHSKRGIDGQCTRSAKSAVHAARVAVEIIEADSGATAPGRAGRGSARREVGAGGGGAAHGAATGARMGRSQAPGGRGPVVAPGTSHRPHRWARGLEQTLTEASQGGGGRRLRAGQSGSRRRPPGVLLCRRLRASARFDEMFGRRLRSAGMGPTPKPVRAPCDAHGHRGHQRVPNHEVGRIAVATHDVQRPPGDLCGSKAQHQTHRAWLRNRRPATSTTATDSVSAVPAPCTRQCRPVCQSARDQGEP